MTPEIEARLLAVLEKLEHHLAAIREAEKKASPGPWTVVERRGVVESVNDAEGYEMIVTDSGTHGPERSDALFIALARSAVPALLAHVEALEKENARLVEEARVLYRDGHRCGDGHDGARWDVHGALSGDRPCPFCKKPNPYRSAP